MWLYIYIYGSWMVTNTGSDNDKNEFDFSTKFFYVVLSSVLKIHYFDILKLQK